MHREWHFAPEAVSVEILETRAVVREDAIPFGEEDQSVKYLKNVAIGLVNYHSGCHVLFDTNIPQ